MTDWYAPNQQAVGMDPAAGGVEPQKKAAPAPAEEKKPATKAKAKDD